MRFNKRQPELIELVPRLESVGCEEHMYNAVAAIGRLRDDGKVLFKDHPDPLARWNRGCQTLFEFLNAGELWTRLVLENQSLEDALAAFISEFEHDSNRIYQLLHSSHVQEKDRRAVLSWLDLTFRFSMYAIISYWDTGRPGASR